MGSPLSSDGPGVPGRLDASGAGVVPRDPVPSDVPDAGVLVFFFADTPGERERAICLAPVVVVLDWVFGFGTVFGDLELDVSFDDGVSICVVS